MTIEFKALGHEAATEHWEVTIRSGSITLSERGSSDYLGLDSADLAEVLELLVGAQRLMDATAPAPGLSAEQRWVEVEGRTVRALSVEDLRQLSQDGTVIRDANGRQWQWGSATQGWCSGSEGPYSVAAMIAATYRTPYTYVSSPGDAL